MFNLEKYVAENRQWITENDVNDAIGARALLTDLLVKKTGSSFGDNNF